jgi:hypothetical protein
MLTTPIASHAQALQNKCKHTCYSIIASVKIEVRSICDAERGAPTWAIKR